MKKEIAIIGGGPAALLLAAHLDETRYAVTIYERNTAPGRKFLVAGDGGFNLTHSEELKKFISRYTPDTFLAAALTAFSNEDLRKWMSTIGIDTYIGSSKRVFPLRGIKPIDVLNAILAVLEKKNVVIKTEHQWEGWNDVGELIFKKNNETISVKPELTIFALGGASWSKTGSDGGWTTYFSEKNISIVPFAASNCGFTISWPSTVLPQIEGKALKNIQLTCGDMEKFGEVIITSSGMEGGCIYALSPAIRKQLQENNSAQLFLDLKPTLSLAEIEKRCSAPKAEGSFTKHIEEKLKLSRTEMQLLKAFTTKEEFNSIESLSKKIKKLELTITGTAPMDEAISTVGGIALEEVDGNFQLKKAPGMYVIGEMLDWDAPTGGYLLQACFSMGYALAKHLNQK